MDKNKNCVRAIFSTVLGGLCLLTFASQLPMAFADYAEGDYLHHLWAMEDQARRNNEAYLNQWRANQNAVRFCAVAYSDSTGLWGYSWGKQTQGEAEAEAKQNCGKPDADILAWCKGSWYCALAEGPDSYGADSGETPEIAKAKALKIANQNGSGNKIILLVGGNPPIVQLNDGQQAPRSNQNAAPARPTAPSTNDFWPVHPPPRH